MCYYLPALPLRSQCSHTPCHESGRHYSRSCSCDFRFRPQIQISRFENSVISNGCLSFFYLGSTMGIICTETNTFISHHKLSRRVCVCDLYQPALISIGAKGVRETTMTQRRQMVCAAFEVFTFKLLCNLMTLPALADGHFSRLQSY